jgi:hypothetical protein
VTAGCTGEQLAWAAKFCNMPDLGLVLADDDPVAAPGSAPAGGSGSTDAPLPDAALPASGNTLFFAGKSHDLTATDTQALDAYATAYLASGSTDPITVEAFASTDGDKGYNQQLSEDRAAAVAAYLTGKGIRAKHFGKGPTAQFDPKDPRQNRRATLSPLPKPVAPPTRPLKSPDELYALGHDAGLKSAPLVCPVDANADGEEAYNRGYSDGMREHLKAGALANIESDLNSHDGKDLEEQINRLSDLSMDDVLDLMEALKKDGQLDELGNHVDPKHIVAGVAILTVNKDFTPTWQDLVSKLGGPAREAILKRVPPGTYTPPKDTSRDGPPDDDGSPVTVGVMFTPQTFHESSSGNSTDPPAVQVQGQYTFKFHRDGKAGFEFSPVAQAQFMYDPTHKQLVTQPMLGAQAAWVEFLTQTIQIQEFAQMMDGVTLEIGKPIGKTLTAKALSTTQAAIGVQAVFSLGGKHLQLVLQAQESTTTTGGAVTVDQQYGFGLQWNF